MSRSDGIKMWRVYDKGENRSFTWESDRVPYGNVTEKHARSLCVEWAWDKAKHENDPGEDVD